MAKKPLRCVLVVWSDSASIGGWHHPAEIDYGPEICHTVGFPIDVQDSHITLALNVHRDGDGAIDKVNSVMTIPKHAIITKKEVKL